MAHITGRRFGEAILLSLPDGDTVLIDLINPRQSRDDVDVHITAPQSVTISRAEDPRTVEDRIRDAS